MKKTVALIAIAALAILAAYTLLPIHIIEQTPYPGILLKHNRYTGSVQMIRVELTDKTK